MQRIFFIGSIYLALALVTSDHLVAQERQRSKDTKSNPAVGSWDLAVDWGKGDDEKAGNHILTINRDLSGIVKDVDDGWTTVLRNLKFNENALTFSFYYGDKKEFSIDFDGKVQGRKIDGTFSAFGAKGKVTGTPLDPAKAKSVKSRPSMLDAYNARSLTSSEGDKMNYRLFVPPNYDAKKKYPIVLFHHGGEGGNDNRSQLEGACVREWIRPEFQAKNPCFIVAPQFPSKKEFAKKERGKDGKGKIDGMKLTIRTIHEILDSLEKEFSSDKNREFVTGLSFGGDCTWFSLFERPKRFAAAVPICAGYTLNSSAAENAKKLADVPLWIFHGDADKVVPVRSSRVMVEALKDAKGKPRYTEYEGVGHNCWDKAYRDKSLITWLFAQSKPVTKK